MSRLNTQNPDMYAFGRTPMFGAPDSVPRFTGPVNINVQGNAAGAMMQLGLPMLMQHVMGPQGMTAGQLFPTQNMFDQMVAQQHFAGQQRAMSMSSRRDTAFIEDFIGGIGRLTTGRNATAEERQRNFGMAQQAAAMVPMAINMFGPDSVDRALGGRSASVLSHHMFAAGRTALDPVTRQIGMTANSASVMSDAIFEQLYGRGASPGAMHSLRTGEVGSLLEQMQHRGLMGSGPRGSVGAAIDEGTVQRLAERLPEMQGITGSSADRAERLERAKGKIRSTHAQIRDSAAAGTPLDPQEIGRLAGGEDVLRVGDVQRITSKLKDMSGAVKAMRDIFGDMGHPNAPMSEIMNGLDALTQGGMSHMSPAQLERTVRLTHALARQTGVGMQAMISLTAQAGNMADKLGLDRSLAIGATQGAVAFGAAAGNVGMPTAWGAVNKEELTLQDQQLRLTAAASPAVNQINAVLRMADEGVLQAPAGSEAAAMVAALRGGQSSYTHNGKTKSMLMGRSELMKIMSAAGVSDTTAMTFMSDSYGGQEYGLKYNTQQIGREMQVEETKAFLANAYAANAMGGSEGKLAALRAAGVVGNDKELAALNDSIGRAQSEAAHSMDLSLDAKSRNAVLGAAGATAIRQAIRAKMPGASEAQIEAATQQALKAYGGENALGATAWAAGGEAVLTDSATSGYKSEMDLLQTARGQEETKKQTAEAQSNADMAEAFGGLGGDSLLSNITGAIADAQAGDSWMTILSRGMGGVSLYDLADKDIVFAGIRDATTAWKDAERDESGSLTSAGLAAREDQTSLVRALTAGGDIATAELARREKEGTLTPEVSAQLNEAIRGGGAASRWQNSGKDEASVAKAFGISREDAASMRMTDMDGGGASAAGPTTADQEAIASHVKKVEAAREAEKVAAEGKGKTKMTIDGTLTIVDGSEQSKIAASGISDVGSTPVVA